MYERQKSFHASPATSLQRARAPGTETDARQQPPTMLPERGDSNAYGSPQSKDMDKTISDDDGLDDACCVGRQPYELISVEAPHGSTSPLPSFPSSRNASAPALPQPACSSSRKASAPASPQPARSFSRDTSGSAPASSCGSASATATASSAPPRAAAAEIAMQTDDELWSSAAPLPAAAASSSLSSSSSQLPLRAKGGLGIKPMQLTAVSVVGGPAILGT